jgi:hypothetical protein
MSRRSKRKARLPKQPKDTLLFQRKVSTNIAKIATDTGIYYFVRLADFPSASEITSLFQFYRIKKFELKFLLVNQPNNNSSFPTLYIAPQQSTLSGTPASRDEVLQYQGVQIHQFGPSNLVKTISTTPCVLLDSSGSVGGGMVKQSPWLSTANNGIIHSAFVLWISRYNSTTDPTHTLELDVTAWFDAKGTK